LEGRSHIKIRSEAEKIALLRKYFVEDLTPRTNEDNKIGPLK
jgi:hypothetical protein